ncbi:restriction endonuclease subunit S [Xanthobacter sp. DSM 24535]|uniref:restriction endonuclease subunit S n=1 Tax=Roseixanthobacter psychrophilus TaxID=3119917 RepID=UPI00372AD58B
MSELPKGWVEARLADVCDLINGRAYKQSELLDAGRYPVLRVGNFFSNRHWYYSDLELSEEKYCNKGDLLYAWSASFGPRIWGGEKAIFHYHIWKTQLHELAVDKLFLFHWFEWDKKNIQADHGTGSTMIHVTKGDMEDRAVTLPPLPEQRRIVAKIDSLTAKSRRARDHLDHIPRLVEKYKQAILAAAFRGDLTREWWARGGADGAAPAALEKLRKEAWATLSSPSRYSAPDGIDWQPDIDLPSGWVWASVDQLSHLIQYGSSAKTNDDEIGVAVLRMGNLQGGSLDLNSLKYLPKDYHEFPTLLLQRGDVLFNRTNSAELVGKTAVYDGEPARASFASYLIRIKVCGLLPRLLSAYVNSPFGREWVASVVNQQVGQANVNGTKLRQLGVPVMPHAEQVELLHRIETAFSWIDRLAAEATSARKLIDRLDQAVLAKAFRGELVPQDPADEPASVLLERIRAERSAAPKPRRGRRPAAEA